MAHDFIAGDRAEIDGASGKRIGEHEIWSAGRGKPQQRNLVGARRKVQHTTIAGLLIGPYLASEVVRLGVISLEPQVACRWISPLDRGDLDAVIRGDRYGTQIHTGDRVVEPLSC